MGPAPKTQIQTVPFDPYEIQFAHNMLCIFLAHTGISISCKSLFYPIWFLSHLLLIYDPTAHAPLLLRLRSELGLRSTILQRKNLLLNKAAVNTIESRQAFTPEPSRRVRANAREYLRTFFERLYYEALTPSISAGVMVHAQ
jgi:hypothetical protein